MSRNLAQDLIRLGEIRENRREPVDRCDSGRKDICKEALRRPESMGSEKRTDCLSWDEYFMAVALLSGQRSKDPNTRVGACVADSDNKIVGVGYNGFPWGCSDDELLGVVRGVIWIPNILMFAMLN